MAQCYGIVRSREDVLIQQSKRDVFLDVLGVHVNVDAFPTRACLWAPFSSRLGIVGSWPLAHLLY